MDFAGRRDAVAWHRRSPLPRPDQPSPTLPNNNNSQYDKKRSSTVDGRETIGSIMEDSTHLLQETLSGILPITRYSLESITGAPDDFRAVFYMPCATEAEATQFVTDYCESTREVLRSATTK